MLHEGFSLAELVDGYSPESAALLRGIALVDGGEAWLAWAMGFPDRYRFSSHAEALEAIQSGLHGRPDIVLPRLGLAVGPARLLTLEPDDLDTLIKGEREGGSRAITAARTVLARHGLRIAADLERGNVWLAEAGVAGAIIFQTATLTDRIAILELATGDEGQERGELDREAAQFAAVESRTPAEFVDHVRLYRALAASGGKDVDTPARRQLRGRRTLEVLQPLVFKALDCPVSPSAAPDDVAATLATWLNLGRLLGVSRVSAGVRQIAALPDLDLGMADAALADYRARVSQAVQQARQPQEPYGDMPFLQAEVDQSGQIWTFRTCAAPGDPVVTLGQGAAGELWLESLDHG